MALALTEPSAIGAAAAWAEPIAQQRSAQSLRLAFVADTWLRGRVNMCSRNRS